MRGGAAHILLMLMMCALTHISNTNIYRAEPESEEESSDESSSSEEEEEEEVPSPSRGKQLRPMGRGKQLRAPSPPPPAAAAQKDNNETDSSTSAYQPPLGGIVRGGGKQFSGGMGKQLPRPT